MHFIIILALFEAVCLTAAGMTLLPLPNTEPLPWLYTALAGFSNTALICLLLNTVTVYPLYKFGLRKTSFATAWIVFLLFSIAAVTDFKVYGIYRFHLNKAMLDLFINGGGDVIAFSADMWTTIIGYCLGLLLATFIVVLLAFFLSRKVRTGQAVMMVCLVIAVFVSCNLVHAVSKGKGVSAFYRNSEVIGLYYPLTSGKLFGGYEAPVQEVSNSGIKYPLSPLRYREAAPDEKLPNIYMIYVDSLRADTLNQDNMPHLYELAANNLNFTGHLSGGNATRNGIFTLFYGLPGSYWNRILNSGIQSVLVTALQDRGYEINAFAGAQLYKPEFNRTVFAKVKNLRIKSNGKSVSEKDADAINDFKSFIKEKNGKPKFAFVFLDKLHSHELTAEEQKYKKYPTPWNSPDYLAIDENFDRMIFLNLYRDVALVIDNTLNDIVNYIKENGDWDNSIVIISSDHGNEFDDNGLGYYGHNSNFTKAQIHIPLVIHWPGKNPHEYGHTTSSYDLTATLLPEILGVTNDVGDYSIGKSLFDETERDPVISSSYLEDAIIKKDRIILSNTLNGISIKTPTYAESDRALTQEDRQALERKLEIDRTYVSHD